jgi:hypothetical protein
MRSVGLPRRADIKSDVAFPTDQGLDNDRCEDLLGMKLVGRLFDGFTVVVGAHFY